MFSDGRYHPRVSQLEQESAAGAKDTLATGDSFDILNFGSLAGAGFDALTLDGAACSSAVTDIWTCGGGVRLSEVINATSLDLVVRTATRRPRRPSPNLRPGRCSRWASLASAALASAALASAGA